MRLRKGSPQLMDTQEELRKYELMVIFSGELPEGEYEKELGELRKLLKESTKGISFEDTWGRRDLAYRIKRQPRGYYAIFHFHTTPESLLELRTTVKLNLQVLRHLLVIVPDDYQPTRGLQEAEPREARTSEEERSKMQRSRPRTRMEAPVAKAAAAVEEAPAKPKLAGKEEEEQLRTVEKKLEKILENPDIDIR